MVSFRFDKNRFIVTGCKGDLLAVLRDVACIVNQLSNKETADGIECAKPIFLHDSAHWKIPLWGLDGAILYRTQANRLSAVVSGDLK